MTDTNEEVKENGEDENEIKMWKVKKLIKNLDNVRGAGTSMISLIIPCGDQVARYTKKLTEEYGTAENIKSRVNRLSVLSAITSAKEKLKLYPRAPPNGLVLYTGTVIAEDGKEKKTQHRFRTS